MGCKWSDFNGKCMEFSEEIEMNGCDESGYCICEEDPDPSVTCEQYQSDGNELDDSDSAYGIEPDGPECDVDGIEPENW